MPQRPKVTIAPPIPEQDAPNVLIKTLNSFLPVFGALATILAVRIFLAFAIVGAFVLAQTAMADTTFHGVWTLVAYCSFTVIPLVYLDIHGHRK